ncbi:MAG: transcriptional repressor [Proteobacteria bacterium]|nr:transcriptional repressor [Pseudomonadota bacterium]
MSKYTDNSKDPKKRLSEMLEKLKFRNFRITPQRYAVLSILAASKDHPGVDQIHEGVKARFPTTSIATVYKTVAMLKEQGEVSELGFHDSNNRYDGSRPYPHPHMICTKCKNIMDLELSTLDEFSREMAKKTGYKIDSHRLDFYGFCPDCQKKE